MSGIEIIELYKIPVRPYGTRYAYMRLYPEQKKSGYEAVFVETERFVAIWDKHFVDVSQPLATDYKLQSGWTDFYFVKGADAPVPLAEVAHIRDDSLRLNHGYTRTIWLLVHGAKVFPLACPLEYVPELQRIAGA